MSRSMRVLLSLAVQDALLAPFTFGDWSTTTPPGILLDVVSGLAKSLVFGSAAAICAPVAFGLALYAADALFLLRRKATSCRHSSPTLEPLSWQSTSVLLCFRPSNRAIPPSTPRSFHDRSMWVIVVLVASISPTYLAPTLLTRLFRKSTCPMVRFDFSTSHTALTPLGSLPMAFHFRFRLRRDLLILMPLARAMAPLAWMLFPRKSRYFTKGLSRMNFDTSIIPSSLMEAYARLSVGDSRLPSRWFSSAGMLFMT
mmetsp:Transcript_37818/g.60954  ORF Transcript_37818/g.60954 Transcript_37818/m.60954 type:complete len:256 (-) Transcript_37818:119-886(-)